MIGQRTRSTVALVAIVALAGCSGFLGPDAVRSTFDDGTEDWTVIGDAQDGLIEPDHVPEGGNSGGYLEAEDDAAGGVWYWNASRAYLGDKSAYVGGTLSFDLRQSATDSQFDSDDVVLVSGDTRLGYDFGNASAHPGTNWTHYEVQLSTDDWANLNDEAPATEEELTQVLSELDELRIRGEYRDGGDTGGIDNVELSG